MSILDAILGPRERLHARGPSLPLSQAPGVLYAGARNAAGVTVTEEGALSLSSVFAAVMLLSRVTATLPLKVYRAGKDDRSRAVASGHPASRVLDIRFNPCMTAAAGRRTLEFHRLTYGNAYGEIGWAGNGTVAAIWPIEPWRVRPEWEGDALVYVVDGHRQVAAGDMIHHTMLSWDGVCGRGWVHYASESLGTSLAAQKYAGGWFGRGARPGGILKHPGTPTPEARKQFRREWQERHGGPDRQGGTAVLWGGWEWAGTDGEADPEKSQLLQQRRFTNEEVARWLNIPPPLLHELTRSTFSNVEELGLNFKVYGLGPTLVEQEQEYDLKLLDPPGLYSKHNLAGLLRGNAAGRASYYSTMHAIGAFSINDILALEEMNPIADGDVHFVPANMVPLARALQVEGEPQEPPPAPPPAPTPVPGAPKRPAPPEAKGGGLTPQLPQVLQVPQAHRAMETLLADTLARMARVECRAVRRAAEKPGRFLVGELLVRQHPRTLAEALHPVTLAAEALGLRSRPAAEVASDWCAASHERLLHLAGEVTPAGLGQAVEAWAASNETERPARFARVLLSTPGMEDEP